MKAVIQRVNYAKVTVNEKITGEIKKGLMVLFGVAEDDSQEKINWIADKILKLRIFNDENDKMNLSVEDINGGILAVSQFTLLADARKGRRPSYVNAASPELAEDFYNKFVKALKEKSVLNIQTGIFGAYMKVELENDGPVTIILEK